MARKRTYDSKVVVGGEGNLLPPGRYFWIKDGESGETHVIAKVEIGDQEGWLSQIEITTSTARFQIGPFEAQDLRGLGTFLSSEADRMDGLAHHWN